MLSARERSTPDLTGESGTAAAAAAGGRGQQQRELARDFRQPAQQQDRRRVGPVQILDGHGDGRRHAPLLDQRQAGLDHRVLRPAVPDQVEDLGGLTTAALPRLQAGMQGREGQALIELVRGPCHDVRDEPRCVVEDGSQQQRLADARLALDQQ
jgi:hypothetical protein